MKTLFCALLLLLSANGFGQENSPIFLNIESSENLIRFENNGYILHLEKERLFYLLNREEKKNLETIIHTDTVLSLNETLDFISKDLSSHFLMRKLRNGIYDLLEKGDAMIMTKNGKCLNHIYAVDKVRVEIKLSSEFIDPATHLPVYTHRYYYTGCPSF